MASEKQGMSGEKQGATEGGNLMSISENSLNVIFVNVCKNKNTVCS